MCVVALAWQADARWPLVLAGNRDEFHARPAAPAARWAEAPHIIAGRDLQSGGSWAGVSDEGRLAVITNVRSASPPDPSLLSRGALISGFLERARGHGGTAALAHMPTNAFNAFLIDRAGLWVISNQPEPNAAALAPGVHGLSNGMLADPWPRKDRLCTALAGWFSQDLEPDALLLALARRDNGVGDHPPSFIAAPIYGTRCSTVIAVDADGRGQFIERSFGANGNVSSEVRMGFEWPMIG